MFKLTFTRFAFASALIACAGLVVASDAEAATGVKTLCDIWDVGSETGPNSTLRLVVHCVGDTNHYGANKSTCTQTSSAEQVKLWTGIATSALLSGRKLNIFWDNTGCPAGTHSIRELYLTTQNQ
jgi:hypothetical protein